MKGLRTASEWEKSLTSESGFQWMHTLYGAHADAAQKASRLMSAIRAHHQHFGEKPVALFSSPGRTEIGGNHTDHNHGRVLAAAVTVDMVAAASPRTDGLLRIVSEGYPGVYEVDTRDPAPREDEQGGILAILRGMVDARGRANLPVQGLDAYITSEVLAGSGLSSSAAFELVIGIMLSAFGGGREVAPQEMAVMAQYAENVHFGKPSGLLDQMAVSVGSLVTIDFGPEKPVVVPLSFDFDAAGYALVVVNTGGDHADLTPEYAAIPAEMKLVAKQFDQKTLSTVNEKDFWRALPELKGVVPDRAILRALHFFAENKRVDDQVAALRAGNVQAFLDLIIASGSSSWRLLQNCMVPGRASQSVTLALGLSEGILSGHGAWRVHGGGFAGTIQAFVPETLLSEYVTVMDAVFGDGACQTLGVRPVGATQIMAEA